MQGFNFGNFQLLSCPIEPDSGFRGEDFFFFKSTLPYSKAAEYDLFSFQCSLSQNQHVEMRSKIEEVSEKLNP